MKVINDRPGRVTLDYDGEGVGVTFGEPTQVPAGFFDSGVKNFKPEQEEAKYEPMDTSGITPMNLLMQAAFAVAGIATDALLTSYLGGDPPRSWSQWASQWGQWIDEKIISGPGPKLDNELSNAVKRGATLQNRQYNTPSAQELQSGKTAAQEALDKAAQNKLIKNTIVDHAIDRNHFPKKTRGEIEALYDRVVQNGKKYVPKDPFDRIPDRILHYDKSTNVAVIHDGIGGGSMYHPRPLKLTLKDWIPD